MGRVIKFCAISNAGDMNYALKVFDEIPKPDTFIYNTIIRGYLNSGLTKDCIILYSQMLEKEVYPNKFTYPCVIRACCNGNQIMESRQIHAHVFKFGFGEDKFCLNNLIHMYVNFESLDDARRVFDKMLNKDFVSWTTLITGYSKLGFLDDAYQVFESMPERNSASWNAMIAGMLSACTGLGALEQGGWIYEHINKSGIEVDSKLATTIIDMYCKCGCLDKAFEVFNGLKHKGISSWNCMIGGIAMHGQGKAAIELFEEMQIQMVAPDGITFVNLLSACAHRGLIEEGRHYFHLMKQVYGIEPRMEHFGCMVDMLGRAGFLEEARKLIDEMPMSPDAGVLGALLGACKIYGEIELGEEIGKRVIELEPHNSGRYVLLANLYANVGRWDDVARVRKLMNDRGVKKVPGFSVIEMDGVVSEFIAGGRMHPESKDIYAKVDEMLKCIRSVGYIPETDAVLHDIVEEEEKENPLYFHSEKLAIAYGLLKTKPGSIIRISKNLRVCKDCHQASKFISKVFDREIIVRDRNRFHHFKNGECSCKDYW
ncbi:hypothetical protein MKW94_024224 [Papaver nudicaule]|uniref:DYW domain-containing protein n=1 Tax=Papaver nudicaule TaxID=74823 RepID=A0AA42B2V4_PAPNU|nr:hypothetical protein [Papaver nudicaule]